MFIEYIAFLSVNGVDVMDKYNEFRLKYPDFYYHGFTIQDNKDHIFITYDFEIKGLMRFNPTLKVPKKQDLKYDKSLLNKIVFSSGLAEIPSYWKATCSPNIIIEGEYLDEYQINWLKKLIYNGLGEFFYVNKIEVNESDFVNIKSNGENKKIEDNNEYDGYLVAVGGGKDSLTSLEILKDIPNKKAFIINVERLFDKKIIDLNNQGFLNGHTPISSCIAFISYLSAYLNGIKYVVLSNESSANESSVMGTNINHQYSKSLEFENDFRSYTSKYLTNKIEYFSLLRPLSELQIMKIFSKYPKYFNHFISCNNGGKRKNIGKTDGWCNSCAKCLFIYILMNNFVSEEELVSIFKENLLDKKQMLNYFLELLGKTTNKPFECVGTIDEVTYVVNNLIKKGGNLPYLLKYYKDNYTLVEPDDKILTKIDTNNNVNEKLLDLIIKELN